MKSLTRLFSTEDIDRIIQMAWEDHTPFEAIYRQFGLKEKEVIVLMRKEIKDSSFRMWRERMKGRVIKHAVKNGAIVPDKFRSMMQRDITLNKISKRR